MSAQFPKNEFDQSSTTGINTGKETSSEASQSLHPFPDGFLWGVATSHFQVEGHPHEIGGRLSDWAQWTTMDGKIFDQSTADKACDFFNHYRSDIELCQNLNLNSFRLGLNWAAICTGPNTDYSSNNESLKIYKEILASLKERGFKTFVTLFHFALPSWLADIGGWNNELTTKEFVRFTEFAARELGDLVDFWLTINEPLVYVYMGYVAGNWPPGYTNNFTQGFECIRNLLIAHGQAYHAIHRELPEAKVSLTHHWMAFAAENKWSPFDHMTKHMRDRVFNHCFMEAIQTGRLEFPAPACWDPRLRDLSGEIPGIKGTIDFLGINYYTRQFCRFAFKWPINVFGVKVDYQEFEGSELGWESYPQGLYDLLVKELRPYRYDHNGNLREIYITENGLANVYSAELSEGDWSLNDEGRVRYLVSHLSSVYRAITDGANVKGYLHWSLLDNFEWAEGLRARFGLVRVAYPTLERTMRKSALIYANIAKRNALSSSTEISP